MKTKLIQYGAMLAIVIASTVFLRTWVNAALYSQPEAAGYPYYLSPAVATTTVAATSSPADKRIAAKLTPDTPTRLLIPSLEIEASVQKVGVNKKGAMGVPSNYRDVAWYAKGTFPGDEGSAVIAGHFDNGLGLSGVFKPLWDIKAGDEIYVETLSGRRLKFVVTSTSVYDYEDPAASTIFGAQPGETLLRLITCGGKWVAKDRTYDKRLVVTAALAE